MKFPYKLSLGFGTLAPLVMDKKSNFCPSPFPNFYCLVFSYFPSQPKIVTGLELKGRERGLKDFKRKGLTRAYNTCSVSLIFSTKVSYSLADYSLTSFFSEH